MENIDEKATFLNILSLALYSRHNDDLGKLFSIIKDEQTLIHIVECFSKQKYIHIPDKEEFKRTLITAMIYYYKNILNMDWKQIEAQFPSEQNIAKEYSKRLNTINKLISAKLDEFYKGK